MQQTRQEMAPSKSWWWNSTNFIGICWWKWFYCWLLYKNFEWKDFEWKDFEPSIIFYFFTIRKMIMMLFFTTPSFFEGMTWSRTIWISHEPTFQILSARSSDKLNYPRVGSTSIWFYILLHREFFWWLVIRITYFHGVTRDTEPWRRIGFQYRSST